MCSFPPINALRNPGHNYQDAPRHHGEGENSSIPPRAPRRSLPERRHGVVLRAGSPKTHPGRSPVPPKKTKNTKNHPELVAPSAAGTAQAVPAPGSEHSDLQDAATRLGIWPRGAGGTGNPGTDPLSTGTRSTRAPRAHREVMGGEGGDVWQPQNGARLRDLGQGHFTSPGTAPNWGLSRVPAVPIPQELPVGSLGSK